MVSLSTVSHAFDGGTAANAGASSAAVAMQPTTSKDTCVLKQQPQMLQTSNNSWGGYAEVRNKGKIPINAYYRAAVVDPKSKQLPGSVIFRGVVPSKSSAFVYALGDQVSTGLVPVLREGALDCFPTADTLQEVPVDWANPIGVCQSWSEKREFCPNASISNNSKNVIKLDEMFWMAFNSSGQVVYVDNGFIWGEKLPKGFSFDLKKQVDEAAFRTQTFNSLEPAIRARVWVTSQPG